MATRRTRRQRRAWKRWTRPGGPAAVSSTLPEHEWDALARDVGLTAAPVGTPGPVPGTAVMDLTLRTYLAAFALWGPDAHRALNHLCVATMSELDTYADVTRDSGLMVGGHLTPAGWDVLRALPPRP